MSRGALVVSIDLEIHWGLLEQSLDGPYRANLAGVPDSVRQTLAVFREFEIAATWAAVGLLFAGSRDQLTRYLPATRPRYHAPRPDPYAVSIGDGEADDPFHYAPSLIAEILRTPRQELATHTFGHICSLEPGENLREAVEADLQAARAIMRETVGVEPRSIVFPRNEHNPAFDDVLTRNGIEAYRGNPDSWIWGARNREHTRFWIRALRRLDAYLGMDRGRRIPWSRLRPIDGLVDIPASFLVRPGASRLRERRLHAAIRRAAKRGEVVHLWWHPHNFGVRTEENMTMLRSLFEVFAEERSARGMMSLSMSDVVDRVSPAARMGRAATV